MNCNENNYQLLTSIKAYPPAGISFNEPAATLNKALSTSDFTPADGDFSSLTSGYVQVPLKASTAKLTEKSEVGVGGESFEVTVKWSVKAPTKDDYTRLDELKRERKHLIVSTYGGLGYLVRSYDYAYLFEYQEDEGNLSCELTIVNVKGAQRIL